MENNLILNRNIKLTDYNYELPDNRIAKYPLKKRDESRLLLYKNEEIEHRKFKDLPDFISDEYQLVFNNTKVLPARIYFQKESGATIEVFLLHPVLPTTLVQEAMLVQKESTWECTVGNLKRWKDNQILKRSLKVGEKEITLQAKLIDRSKRHVQFSWEGVGIPFVDVIIAAGEVPLPPYLNRKPIQEDKETYQTIYSKEEGAVAAPTAGLHFTPEVLEGINKKGILTDEVTLHVGAGTFQPIKTENVLEHTMHNEQVVISKKSLQLLLENKKVIPVGTTSMRTLESLYWYGVKLLETTENNDFFIEKLFPYQDRNTLLPDKIQAFKAILKLMEERNLEQITGETEIFIFPGYQFKVCEALITNFHQPSSTLILLVAAFVGDNWKKIYNSALENDYRFLSYGDSSLLFRP
ncbi:S-adenosylmethionine:tRNA ribosyltransferase-isomerase [Flexithrix dorotheae]|uniref:S-adenosylmethionine:tRNA ribosyltransferase-isomerase n=1 Tax=Flexithrix dorotheae TaxID=70993 RepID=UPI00037AE81B|nr:S-adenosylmethionine:tRNA ribosyltransferase-isomerase [Flexithrix dorotheae]